MNKDKRFYTLLTCLPLYSLIICLIILNSILINSLFYIYLNQQALILSTVLATMLSFSIHLILYYNDQYSPVPSTGKILTIPEKDAAKSISHYLKGEFRNCEFNEEFKKDLVQGLKHEKIHWKISKRFKIKSSIHLKLSKYQEAGESFITPEWWYNGYFPQVERFNKFYPRFFLVNSIQSIFDIIWDLTHNVFFYNFHMRVLDSFFFSGSRLKKYFK